MVGVSSGAPRFANVYKGTSTGRINEISQSIIGYRIVKEEQFGTIKYVGPIVNSKVTWLGIDWDNDENGRHDGTFMGTKYFDTHHPTSGSFLKPEKASFGTSLEESLVTRYALCAECQIVTRNPSIFQSGGDPSTGVKFENCPSSGHFKATMDVDLVESQYLGNQNSTTNCPFTVEIFTSSCGDTNSHETCGAGGAIEKLSRLRVACVQGMPVYRGLKENEPLDEDVRSLWPGTAGHMSHYLSSLRELDLSGCLISKWIEVANICSQLPLLTKLNVGSNYLRLPRTAEDELLDLPESRRRLILDIDSVIETAESLCSSAFKSITRLVTVQMPSERGGFQFGWREITRILGWMPSLQEICMAYNELGDLPDPSTDLGGKLTSLLQMLIEIDFTATGMTNFSKVVAALGGSKNLKNLILNKNRFSELRFPSDTPVFPSLEMFTLRDNLINHWESINTLNQLPSLTNLIISRNPILESVTLETARQEVIARLPRLKYLNRQEIERDERRGAELDFLKRYSKAWIEAEKSGEEAKLTFEKMNPEYKPLCNKHGAPEHEETKPVIRALKEGLIELTICCEPSTESAREVVRRLPSRMTVKNLRSLTRRLFNIPPTASISLSTWTTRPGFGKVEVPLHLDTRELGYYGVASGDRLVARWSS